ncbi:MAG TPA: zinc-binding alcohol dehydrogenase family protein [Solirubrobacteraceae bacterium]|jgi:NADPH:quinone reductase-like Zn-dependent oxidoreductase|nr:zinc-binding alcohol dehydrogenase family protein [Solirubrobacteraceae bacterium]
MVGITNHTLGALMHAAVVRSFDAPPRYETFATPAPGGEHEIAVDLLAAGLHPRVRSGASGSHYTSTVALPLIPGIDGVGRAEDGRLLYFVAFDGALGTMAERNVIDRRRAVTLPDDADVAAIAAAMNPGMSSWMALRKRISFEAGQNVLVLGATGSAGRLAVQIAKLLGAGHVVAAGRSAERLTALGALGADRLVSLTGEPDEVDQALAAAASDVDVVIDYLWGSLSERAIPALVKARPEPSRPLSWIQIGSMAGATITLPSAALRAANLQLLGSGQGSLTTAAIVAELPQLAEQISAGSFAVEPVQMPLSEVESAWNMPTEPGERIVFVT